MWKTLDELLQCESALQRVPEQTHHTEKSSLRAKNHFFQRNPSLIPFLTIRQAGTARKSPSAPSSLVHPRLPFAALGYKELFLLHDPGPRLPAVKRSAERAPRRREE